MSRLPVLLAAALFIVACGASLVAILPPMWAIILIALFAWSAIPGIAFAARIYRGQPGAMFAALLVGPVWGFALSSLVLLVLWIAGVRQPLWLALAPAGALLIAWPCARITGLTLPVFTRRDVLPVLLVALMVPLVDGLPYAKVGEIQPEGKAYRAYFIADFVWAMSVTAELAKGEVPPINPFLAGEHLHYYWLSELASAVEYRVTREHLIVDQVLLANGLLLDLAFVGFFYFFVRHFVREPSAAAIGCIAAVLFTSFEGTERLWALWGDDRLWDTLRRQNIDAISNWQYGTLKVDGLQRLLLWQPHHALSWALGLSALAILMEARDNGRVVVNLLAGALLALALLISSFLAIMVGIVVALYQAATLLPRWRPKELVLAAIGGGLPVALAVLVANRLEYVDPSAGKIVYLGWNTTGLGKRWVIGIVLSFGPMLIAALTGGLVGIWRRERRLGAAGLMTLVGVFFYFYVDVIDHQHAYVGWRAGHLLFMAFAPLAGFAWQELRALPRARAITLLAGVLLALSAAPMTAIDLYNAQDTTNRAPGPGFFWTEIISNDELAALDWIKKFTPPDALVQVLPNRPDGEGGTWAYMPAFGERRMTAGTPISMIPLKKYQDASARVDEFFKASDAGAAYAKARDLQLQYIYVGPAELRHYPRLREVLDRAPYWFRPVFHNDGVAIYKVS